MWPFTTNYYLTLCLDATDVHCSIISYQKNKTVIHVYRTYTLEPLIHEITIFNFSTLVDLIKQFLASTLLPVKTMLVSFASGQNFLQDALYETLNESIPLEPPELYTYNWQQQEIHLSPTTRLSYTIGVKHEHIVQYTMLAKQLDLTLLTLTSSCLAYYAVFAANTSTQHLLSIPKTIPELMTFFEQSITEHGMSDATHPASITNTGLSYFIVYT